MSQERLTVRKIREILRLKYELGLTKREVGRACRVSCNAGYWFTLFTTMQNYARQYLALLKANEGSRILEHVNQFALLISSAHTPLEKYQQYFWSGAAYNLLTEWIRNGMVQTPEEMAEICQSIF
jgi:hypothetical protein